MSSRMSAGSVEPTGAIAMTGEAARLSPEAEVCSSPLDPQPEIKRRRPFMALFRDRVDAGWRLAEKLMAFAGRNDVIVLGLPRGGVPLAEQVALALGAALDVFVVRKVGVPGREELAMGA